MKRLPVRVHEQIGGYINALIRVHSEPFYEKLAAK